MSLRGLAVLIAGALPAAAAAPPAAGSARAVRVAAREVLRRINPIGTALEDRAGSTARLTVLWRVTRRWAAARLAAGASVRQIEREARRDFSSRSLGVSGMRLDPNSVVFSAGIDDLGTFFILRRTAAGGYVTALDIGNPASWRAPHAPIQLMDWVTHSSRPLSARLLRLPAAANGDRRFAVVGTFAQAAGATQGFQVSVWRWNGRSARPLAALNLAQMADEPLVVRVGRRRLILHAKTAFHSFWSCGGCVGRQVAITIGLERNGARLGAARSLAPALDLADAFDGRAFRCRPVGPLVAPDALARLRGALHRMCRAGHGRGGAVRARRSGEPRGVGGLDADGSECAADAVPERRVPGTRASIFHRPAGGPTADCRAEARSQTRMPELASRSGGGVVAVGPAGRPLGRCAWSAPGTEPGVRAGRHLATS